VLAVDAARPPTRKIAAQGFRLSQAAERIAPDSLDQFKQPSNMVWIFLKELQDVAPSVSIEMDVHLLSS
jgi:hypothetical protein